MKLLGLLCINVLMVNLIVGLTLKDQYEDPIVRIAQLQYEDYQYQVVKKIGTPTSKGSGKWHYRYDSYNNLVINWSGNRLVYARADFSKPVPFYRLGVSDRAVLLESNENWAKIGVPEQGHLFEVNSLGAVLSLEVAAPWKSKKKFKKVSAILIEAGLVPHMAMRENIDKRAR